MWVFWAGLGFGLQAASAATLGPSVKIVLMAGGSSNEQVLREVLPSAGSRWVLPTLLEQSMAALTPEVRAQVDLVILRGESGQQAWIPRAFLSKVQMRLEKEQGPSTTQFKTVMPASVRTPEDLPWGTYEIKGVTRVELTSYQAQWGSHLLKRRTDPAALRGEKLFVQNCMSCHAAGVTQWKTVGSRFSEGLPRALSQHPMRDGLRKLDDRSSRALISYWNAWLSEQGKR